jgi:uncharacterized protein YciI
MQKQPSRYYVVFCQTRYGSFDDAASKAPHLIVEHIARSKELHEQGKLLMSGAFLDKPQEPLSTMGVLVTREDAEEYMRGDPFVLAGMASNWYIREWANMFA